ncbi:hypothetical protein Poli38472_011311 [Pythium oligandrum]|uniref:Uncharacterized protein n=1 Tax=Pythium oligandrum TaxID=41045 RepID=A0A8K1CS71_PYTOL|nr:hypothetical protein Poli38472_011311 [Pythium oligandrum]|eukprot:TMW67691.1 hypothetical protein Poli38472_011311 [Pythium oligandrum]
MLVPRSLHWGHGYVVMFLAMAANLVLDAYWRAVDVCELFPQFDFPQTFQEEILLHHTRLPLVRWPVSTVLVLGVLLVLYIAAQLRLIELAWLFLIDVLSGRWLYNLFFVQLPAWLPFLASDPGVPDLLSDVDDDDIDDLEWLDNNAQYELDDEAMPALHDDVATCSHQAMEKLVQVKLEHANRVIKRPDDWLVFDPERETLVLQKELQTSPATATEDELSDVQSTTSTSKTQGADESSERDGDEDEVRPEDDDDKIEDRQQR